MIKKDKVRDLHYVLSGVIDAGEIVAAQEKILAKYGEKAKMPGFRAGHVPMNVLKTKFGADAWADAVQDSINADLQKFAADKKLRLAAAPKLDMQPVKEGEAGEYSLEFDVLPEMPAIPLEKYTLVKKVAEVVDAEVDKALTNIAKTRAQYEKAVDASRKAAKGDIAVIDFKGFADGVAFEGGEAKKHHLELGSGQFIPGFEDQIIGHKVGEKFDINVKFPKEYGASNLAGKEAKFEIELHEIRVPSEVKIDDEFAKSVGQESLAKLREHIVKILAEQYEAGAQRCMKDELLDILADKVKMDLPEVLVSREIEIGREEAAAKKDAKFDEKAARKDAERRVKLGLILAEWGNAEKVEISQQEIQQAIFNEAMRGGANPQAVFDYYSKNQQALGMLRGILFEQKVMDLMIARAGKKEKKVAPEELFKQK